MAYQLVIEQGGTETIALTGTLEAVSALLEAKRVSHIAHGWTVVKGIESIDCSKEYELRSPKQRRLFIRQE